MNNIKYFEKTLNMKKVYTDNLIKKGNKINWIASVGKKVKCVYDDLEFEVKIESYDYSSNKINIVYKDNEPFAIGTNNFLKCNLGKCLGLVTSEFKMKIGTRFKDDRRDITIIDSEYRIKHRADGIYKKKYYKYKCNKCPNVDWILESNLLNNKGGCNVCGCTSPKPLLGYNTVYDCDKYTTLAIGEESAKKVTCGSDKQVKVICPVCGREKHKKLKINSIHYSQSIGCEFCSDGVSFPNKMIRYIIEYYYNIGEVAYFEPEYSPEWVSDKKYDCYFICKDKKYIVEMDGDLGHGNKIHTRSKMTIKESKEIDEFKDTMASIKMCKMIRIDCKYKSMSERFEFIKNNILKSELSIIFDLKMIDWNDIEKKCKSSLFKIACNLKNNNPDMTTTQIAEKMHMNSNTIRVYLIKGTDLGWCAYNPDLERKLATQKVSELSIKRDSKIVEVFKDGKKLGEYPSEGYIEVNSLKLFGIKLLKSKISKACNSDNSTYNGYEFRFKHKYIKEISERTKLICKYKKDNPDITTTEIAKKLDIHITTVIEHLKMGEKLGLCHYNTKEETQNRINKLIKRVKEECSKPIKVYRDGVFIGRYPSDADLVKCSLEDLKVKLYPSGISKACKNNLKYKGFILKRV